jgi:hypothetical protein
MLGARTSRPHLSAQREKFLFWKEMSVLGTFCERDVRVPSSKQPFTSDTRH